MSDDLFLLFLSEQQHSARSMWKRMDKHLSVALLPTTTHGPKRSPIPPPPLSRKENKMTHKLFFFFLGERERNASTFIAYRNVPNIRNRTLSPPPHLTLVMCPTAVDLLLSSAFSFICQLIFFVLFCFLIAKRAMFSFFYFSCVCVCVPFLPILWYLFGRKETLAR